MWGDKSLWVHRKHFEKWLQNNFGLEKIYWMNTFRWRSQVETVYKMLPIKYAASIIFHSFSMHIFLCYKMNWFLAIHVLDTWKHLDVIVKKKTMRFVDVREFLECFSTESWKPWKNSSMHPRIIFIKFYTMVQNCQLLL